MKKLILGAVLLLASMSASADYVDVIEFKLTNGTLPEYLSIVRDFNVWGRGHGYQAEILRPIHRSNLETMFWAGRTTSAKAFGNAWDVWRDAQKDPNSVPAKLATRFAACETNLNRAAFDTYK